MFNGQLTFLQIVYERQNIDCLGIVKAEEETDLFLD